LRTFVGHHCEAHAGLACPRGFHGRIQRQDIGLECNLIDGFYDFRDLKLPKR